MTLVAATLALTATAASATTVHRITNTPIGPDGGEISWVTVHPNLTLAVGGIGPVTAFDLSSVWASTDHERSWHRASARERASLALPPEDERQRDPVRPNVYYRLRPGRDTTLVEVSTDGGRSFTVRSRRALRHLDQAKLLVTRSRGRTVLLVGAGSGGRDGEYLTGVRRSLDGGYTWATMAGTAGRVVGMWQAPDNPGTLYVGVEGVFPLFTPESASGWRPGTAILRSRDAGQTWRPTGRRVPETFSITDPQLALSAANPSRLLFGTGDGIFRSGDGGATWTRVLRASVSTLASHPALTGHVVAGSDSGVWNSDDGGRTWKRANTGLKATWADQLLPTGDAGRVYAVGTFDVPRLAVSDNRGATWSMRGQPFSGPVVADPADANALVASGDPGLLRTRNAGRSWVSIARNLGDPIAIDVTTRRLFATNVLSNQLMYSDDFGDRWARQGGPVPNVNTLLADGGVLYAANIFKGNTVWRQTGSGGWTQGAPFGGAVLDLAVAPSKPATIYATSFSRNVLFGIAFGKSVDGGATWHLISMTNTRSTPLISSLAVDRANPRRVFAGRSQNGLAESRDAGVTWTKIADIPGFITKIVQHPTQPNLLYVATMNDGAWRVELTP